jgi:hypothetical protein
MLGMLGSLFTKDFCFVAWHQWLTPVIVATQESEISSIAVQSQSRQIVQETLSQKKKKSQKRAGTVAQNVDPEFKPQYHKQKQRFLFCCVFTALLKVTLILDKLIYFA